VGEIMNYNFITINDDVYPECLKEISNPPLKLYYKGNLDLLKEERLIAVVGTRNPSSYGKLCCEYMVKKMTSANITIVSGFAKGIDSIAHKTSLLTDGKTIAVIASGLDIVYPASNLSLYREIEEKGLILSEYEAGVKPFKFNFPQRNRIIAGLSKNTIKYSNAIFEKAYKKYSNKNIVKIYANFLIEIKEYRKAEDILMKYIVNSEDNLDEYALLKILYTKENNKQKLESLKKILRNKI